MNKSSREELEKMLANKSARIYLYWGNDECLVEWLEDNDVSLYDVPIADFNVEANVLWIEGCNCAINLNDCTIGMPMKDRLKAIEND